MGRRRAGDGITAVFSSDLTRGADGRHSVRGDGDSRPARLAAAGVRLRGAQRDAGGELHAGRREHLDQPYPGGESWRQAVARIGRFLEDLPLRWDGQRVLVIGHVATRWGLDRYLNDAALEALVAEEFSWQEGWEYQLG